MINEDKKEIMDCHAALAMTFPCHTELVSGSHNFAPSPLVGEGMSTTSFHPRRSPYYFGHHRYRKQLQFELCRLGVCKLDS